MTPLGPGLYGPQLAGFIKRTSIHSYIQNGKALGPCGLEEEGFLFFFILFPLKAMGANDPQGGAIFDPRGMVGRIYKEHHYTLLHTALGFVVSEKKTFLCFFQ